MTINQKTLYLNPDTWDLELNSSGSIKTADAPYSIAQDVATAVRTFKGECWYDTDKGIPYWSDVLGKRPALSYIRSKISNEALSIDNVSKVKVTFDGFSGRELTGQIQIIDSDGESSGVTFSS